MGGIFGIVGAETCDQWVAQRALSSLTHRGADQIGVRLEPGAFIGYRRLSIRELSEYGRQALAFADQPIISCANGAIYNYQELRSSLSETSEFWSHSDSEVVLRGYQEWGVGGLLERIYGMFTVAILDRRGATPTLHLDRERFGKKPLYCAQNDLWLIYSREIKAILGLDSGFRCFSRIGVSGWLQCRGSSSGRTIYTGICELPVGHIATFRDGRLALRSYCDLLDLEPSAVSNHSDPDTEFTQLFRNAVEKRLVSDVTVGLQLSGGVDSSLVAHASHEVRGSVKHLFSVGFAERQFAQYGEESYAQCAASQTGLEHHQLNITASDVGGAFNRVIWLFDGMLEYPNTIPICLLSKYAKQWVTVFLIGEGAGELFDGYTKFPSANRLNLSRARRVDWPALIDEYSLTRLSGSRARHFFLKRRYAGEPKGILEKRKSYVSSGTLDKSFGSGSSSLHSEYERLKLLPFSKRLILPDHRTYLPSLLIRQDKARMGATIESRPPFLDRALVEWAVSLGQDQTFNNDATKKILERKSASIFGRDFVYRKKMGCVAGSRLELRRGCFRAIQRRYP